MWARAAWAAVSIGLFAGVSFDGPLHSVRPMLFESGGLEDWTHDPRCIPHHSGAQPAFVGLPIQMALPERGDLLVKDIYQVSAKRTENRLGEREDQQPTSRVGYALLCIKIASAVVLYFGFLKGSAEAIHRIWTAASNAEFSAKPVNPVRVKALYGAGVLVLLASVALSLPVFAVLAWWVGGGNLWN